MTVLRYVGPHEAVEVPLPSGALAFVKNGELLETTGDHAAALLDQPINWEPERKAQVGPTNDELKAQLKALEVSVPSGAVKADLLALLEQAQAPKQDNRDTPQGEKG